MSLTPSEADQGSIPRPEALPKKEDSRATVLNALHRAENFLSLKIPKEELTLQEGRTLESVQVAYRGSIGQGKDTYTNNFGDNYSQEEGIPVDELIQVLRLRANSLPTTNLDRDKLLEDALILERNSKKYEEMPDRVDSDKNKARTQKEANLISEERINPNNQFHRPDPNGNDESDWYKAEAYLRNRRELVIPDDKNDRRQVSKPRSRLRIKREADRQRERVEKELDKPPVVVKGPDKTGNQGGPNGPEHVDQPPLTDPEIYESNMINDNMTADKAAQLEALKNHTESLRQGRWWSPIDAIKRTGMRWLGKGLIIKKAEELRGLMVTHNTSALGMNEAGNAAALANAVRNGQTEQAQLAQRFKEGNLRGNEITEVATGELKKLIRTQIMAQIVDNRDINTNKIVTPDELRVRFAEFIRNQLTNSTINEPGGTETVGAQMQRLFGAEGDEFGRIADYFASDMLKVGGRIRTSLERHQGSLDNLDQKLAEMDDRIIIKLGRANMGSGGETRDFIDKMVISARRRQSTAEERAISGLAYNGIVLNPTVVGIAAALAYQGIFVAGRRIAVGGAVAAGVTGTFATGGLAPLVIGAVAGGLMAAGRRYYELGNLDRVQHNMERANGEQLTDPSRNRFWGEFQKWTGGGSRKALESFRHNAVTADRLINGDQGNTNNLEPISNGARRSVTDLLGLNLSHGNDNNRAEVARRIAEIQTRLDFVSNGVIDVTGQKIRTLKADLLEFKDKSDTYTAPTELLHQAAILRRALETDGYTAQEIQVMLTTERQAMSRFFIGNVEQRNREFQVYRAGNALMSGVFAGTVGFAVGFVGQRALEGIANLADNFRPSVASAAELEVEDKAHASAGVSDRFLNRTTFQDLSQKGGTLRHDGFNLAVDEPKLESAKNPFDHTGLRGGFVDGSNTRVSPPTHVIPAAGDIPAKIIVSGSPDNLPEIPKNVMTGAGWQHEVTPDLNYNVRADVKDMLSTGRPDGFIHGDMRIIVNDLANREEWYKLHDTQGVDMPGSKDVTFIYQDNQLGEIVMHAKGEVVNDVPQLKFDPRSLSTEQWQTMQAQLQKDGWGIAEGVTIEQPVLGAGGEWLKHTTPVERQWYGYNTPWSELNELREYSMNKVGTKVTLDMSSMQISSQSELNPPVVNVPDVIARHEAAWAFTLPGQMDKPFIVSDGADGVFNGQLTLDPNDNDPTHFIDTPGGRMQLGEFSKILLNQERLAQIPDGNIATEYYTNFRGDNRLDVWRLNGGQQGGTGFISAGRYINQGGKGVFQSFATIRGTGVTPETITTGGGISLIPPEATVYTPPVAPPRPEPIPFVPIPFAPRHPLDPTKPGPMPPPPPGPPKPPVVGPDVYYGYGDRTGKQVDVSKLKESESEIDRARTLLPILLPIAFDRWGVNEGDQRIIRGLTIPEQLRWLKVLALKNDTNTLIRINPDGAQSGNVNLNDLMIMLRPGPGPASGSRKPETLMVDEGPGKVVEKVVDAPVVEEAPDVVLARAERFIAHDPESPIVEDAKSRTEEIDKLEDFATLGDIEEAASRGGINQTQAIEFYQELLRWRAKQNAIDLMSDDVDFESDPNYKTVLEAANSAIWDDDEEAARGLTNAGMRVLRQFDAKYQFLNKGNVEANLYVLFSAFARINSAAFKPQTS